MFKVGVMLAHVKLLSDDGYLSYITYSIHRSTNISVHELCNRLFVQVYLRGYTLRLYQPAITHVNLHNWNSSHVLHGRKKTLYIKDILPLFEVQTVHLDDTGDSTYLAGSLSFRFLVLQSVLSFPQRFVEESL